MNKQQIRLQDHTLSVQAWLLKLNALSSDISAWVGRQSGWTVDASTKEIVEESLGSYNAPVLNIHAQTGRLTLEPIALNVMGGRGSVELTAWPTLYRVRLIGNSKNNDWRILTDSGIYLSEEWNEKNFIALAQNLICVE